MWLGIAIAVGLIVWAVGGLIALNPLPWHIRKYWDRPGEKELRIIQAIALLLIVAGVTVFFVTEPGTFWHDLWPEMISTGGAILGIDELNRRRSAQEYKREIIQQMGSFSNDFALEATRIIRDMGWFNDGSLRGMIFQDANLEGADLQGADLQYTNLARANLKGRTRLWDANLEGTNLVRADLQGTSLWRANLQGASLVRARLQEAQLWKANLQWANLKGVFLTGADLPYAILSEAELPYADLKGADLRGVNFTKANLEGINLTGAFYSDDTRWPDGFDPISKESANWDKLNEKEREDWLKRYRPERPWLFIQ